MTTSSTPSSETNFKDFVRFGAVGAFGGLCAFLLSRLLLIGPFAKSAWPLDLCGEIALGGLAALFGVFLLTASDLSASRTMVFALACGFFWNPILSSTQAYVTQHADNTSTVLATSGLNTSAQLSGQTTQQSATTVASAAKDTSAAIGNLSKVSADARQKIVTSSTQTLQNISAPATATPASVQAITQIATASQQNGATSVHTAALDRLNILATTARDESTRTFARQAAVKLNAAAAH